MLDVKLANAGVVVLSAGHNPSILNPDFLERNEIVPKGWRVAQVIVTSPFSSVRYDNGIQIQVEQAKLQFTVADPGKVAWQEIVPPMVIRYLDTLPHVAYNAVGLNYTFNSEKPLGQEAEDQLLGAMLVSGPWLKFGNGTTGAVVELQYRATEPHLNLKIGVRARLVESAKMVLEGYTFIGNFHHDFQPDQKIERHAFIGGFGRRQDELLALINLLPLRTT
jgi:hypothetical protein